MRVQLSFSIDDDSRCLWQAMSELDEIHRELTDRKWQIRCGQSRYLGPWISSVLYAAYLKGRERGQDPKIRLPSSPPALDAYCGFSGMKHAFQGGPEPNPDHSDSETVPLMKFDKASWSLSDGIVRLLRRHTQLSDESEDQIRTCIQEVTQNVVDHARSSIGGTISARYMSASREVRVGIVDRGIGIGSSLRQRFTDITDSFAALSRVIEGGYSSMSRPNNMGLGVSNLFKLVRNSGGRIAVFSGIAMA